MTLEFWSTIASIGTFIVIASTAVAALVQLRHMRSGNQIAALNEMRETLETPDIQAAARFVGLELPAILKDPDGRARLEKFPLDADLQGASTMANFFENVGTYVEWGIIDKDVALDLWGAVIVNNWEFLEPFILLRRRKFDSNRIWENFEYLTVLARENLQTHPEGQYPPGVPRILSVDVKQ